ncbi:MAG: acyltransferase [Sphingobium sp.]
MKTGAYGSESRTGTSPGRLLELDALRGIGAIAVVLFHYTMRFPQLFPQADPVPMHFWQGEYRVLLFFAISGFAIFFSMSRIGSVADFVVNRFARLFPAYWVAIILTLSFEYGGGVDTLIVPVHSALANFTMLQGFLYLPAVDGAYWTLTIELGFYACMTGLWLMLGREFRRLEPMLLLWLALKWLMLVWPAMPSRLTILLVLEFAPFFIIGIIFHRIWSGQRRWRAQLPYLAAALLTLAATESRELFLAGCVLVAIFALILNGVLRFLCVRPVLWFGSISYPLYLVHENVGFVIMLKAHQVGLNHWVGFATALAIVVALAWLLHVYVERPVGDRLSCRWKNRQRLRAVSTPQSG